MADMIGREALLSKLNGKAIENRGSVVGDIYNNVIQVVKRMPYCDAETVVRCKDCSFGILWFDGSIECEKHVRETDYEDDNLWMLPDDFCSYGEKRSDENS